MQALKLVQDIPELKLIAMDFFLAHEAVMIHKNINELGSEILSEIFRLRLNRPEIPSVQIPACTLTEDLGKLLRTGAYSDCICRQGFSLYSPKFGSVHGKHIKTHKCILGTSTATVRTDNNHSLQITLF
jgi:hypothetical protein